MSALARTLTACLGTVVLGFGVAGCGGDDEPSTSSSGSGSPTTTQAQADSKAITKDPANASTTLTVGSKNFAEQYILGEIYAQAFEAAGFTVEKELDLGSEQIAFKALKSGRIDAYPEYTGTALTSFYKVKTDDVPRDEAEAFTQLQEKLKADQILAYDQTPFQNTFKITSTKAFAEELGNPKTISELVEKAPDKSISGFPECRQRTDCLLGLNEKYGWKPKFVSSQGQYTDLDKDQSDFTFGFSTDGALSTGKYVTYEDDKMLFPPYFVTLLTRQDAADKLGEPGKELIAKIQEPLTEEVMQELNSRVSIDKQEPEAVAAAYLQEAGFLPK